MRKLIDALHSVFSNVDPKVLHVPLTTALTWLIAHVGLNVDDPTVLIVIGLATNSLIGFLIPNAASKKTDRWTDDDDPVEEPDRI